MIPIEDGLNIESAEPVLSTVFLFCRILYFWYMNKIIFNQRIKLEK